MRFFVVEDAWCQAVALIEVRLSKSAEIISTKQSSNRK